MTDIAICISTRNRLRFIPWVKSLIMSQTAFNRIGCIVIVEGESEEIANAWKVAFPSANVIYHNSILLGHSRNIAIETASTYPNIKYISLWDDDDYYLPRHLEESLGILEKNPDIDVVGSSKTIMYFVKHKLFVQAGPYSSTHALEPSIVFRASYGITHKFPMSGEECRLGQAKKFLDCYNAPIITKEPSYLHLAHGANLFEKEKILFEPFKYKATILDCDKSTLFNDWICSNDHQRLFGSLF